MTAANHPTSLARVGCAGAASRAARLRNSAPTSQQVLLRCPAKNSSDELPCQDSAQETAALACLRHAHAELSVPAGQEAAFRRSVAASHRRVSGMRQSWARRPSFSEEGRVRVLWLRLEASIAFLLFWLVLRRSWLLFHCATATIAALGISVACNREE